MKKNKLFERGMSLFLSFAMLLGMFPTFVIETEALENGGTLLGSGQEPSEEFLLETKENIPSFPLGKTEDGYLTITTTTWEGTELFGSGIAGSDNTQAWAREAAFKDLRNIGVYFGMMNPKGNAEPFIDGLAWPMLPNDMLGLALIYYWPSINNNGFRTYNGASPTETRQEVFRNAHEYIEDVLTKEQIDNINQYAMPNGEVTRLFMIALVCSCLERVYGLSASNFSATELGKDKGGKTVTGKTNPASTFKDKDEIEALYGADEGTLVMQWLNMALYYEIISGDVMDNTSYVHYNLGGKVLFSTGLTMLKRTEEIGNSYGNGGSGGGGGGYDPVSDITADISTTQVYKEFNYKDFENGETVKVYASGDTSGSYSALDADFSYHIEDALGNSDSQSGSGKSFTASSSQFSYTKTDFGGYTHDDGLARYEIPYAASIIIMDELGGMDSANDSGDIVIQLTNEDPYANFTNPRTTTLPNKYQEWFFYQGEPVEFTNKVSDPEGCVEFWSYTIKAGSRTVGYVDSEDGNEFFDNTYLENFKIDRATNVISFTPLKMGIYSITGSVWDEMGAENERSVQFTVTTVPSEPTAKIDAKDYSFKNYDTKIKDASTDPNKDIVSWTWADIEYFEAELDENGDETDIGVWRKAVIGTDYTGTLASGTKEKSMS